MVWVGRDLKDHLVPTPCHGQKHLPLDQVAQSPSQPGFGHFQVWGIHSFSGQPVPELLESVPVKGLPCLCCLGGGTLGAQPSLMVEEWLETALTKEQCQISTWQSWQKSKQQESGKAYTIKTWLSPFILEEKSYLQLSLIPRFPEFEFIFQNFLSCLLSLPLITFGQLFFLIMKHHRSPKFPVRYSRISLCIPISTPHCLSNLVFCI